MRMYLYVKKIYKIRYIDKYMDLVLTYIMHRSIYICTYPYLQIYNKSSCHGILHSIPIFKKN